MLMPWCSILQWQSVVCTHLVSTKPLLSCCMQKAQCHVQQTVIEACCLLYVCAQPCIPFSDCAAVLQDHQAGQTLHHACLLWHSLHCVGVLQPIACLPWPAQQQHRPAPLLQHRTRCHYQCVVALGQMQQQSRLQGCLVRAKRGGICFEPPNQWLIQLRMMS